MAAPDQCALAADGSLLDASAIIFYNDPDDDAPLPNSAATSTPVHAFFRGGPAPGKIAAGSRRSARVTRPSACIIDPDNVEASAVTRKRSATVTASVEASLRAARDDDVGTGGATTEEEGGGDGTDVELIEESYRTTKAMGDADRQVCLKILVQARHEYLISGCVVPWRASQDHVHC
ncbi:hypothetical protein L208DRAFT_1269364 [Tricholoma matsutake]|nr:hypothetical protein L208DRAFT_1269364 [Tricholoma matsutake 945]